LYNLPLNTHCASLNGQRPWVASSRVVYESDLIGGTGVS
jgi:hypothetical protein